MGWDVNYRWTKKADVVADLLGQYSTNPSLEVLAFKSTSSGLWTVIRNQNTGSRAIYFDLIERRGKQFAVKGMDEAMGPYYYDCPAKFFTMVPVGNPAYRARWAEAHGVKLS
jgi:hypothetical protein